MTKYYNDKNKFRIDSDTPISVPNYEQIERDSRVDHYCPYCQLRLSRLIDSSGLNPNWYCSKCTIEYPNKSETKSKSHLSTPQKSNNERPAVSYPPEPTIGRQPVEPKGVFAEMKKKGMKIKNYKEGKG